MKLLSMKVTRHDANMSYFDGEKVHYHKTERTKQIKYKGHNSIFEWQNELWSLWKVRPDELDEIAVIIDEQDFGIDVTKNENLVCELYNFPASCKVWKIDHHYAHSLSSWMIYDGKPDVSIVMDGLGDDRIWTVFRDDKVIDCGFYGQVDSIGFEMENVGKNLGIKSKFLLDCPGKVMGLQSYGNVDYQFLNYLRGYNINQVESVFSVDNWINYKEDSLIAHHTLLDWIKTVHTRVGEILVDFFKTYVKEDEVVHYSGGVAHNVIWNTQLKKVFKNLIVAPHCSDEGLSLGGLEWLRLKNNLPPFKLENFPYVQSDEKPEEVLNETIRYAAKKLSEGHIVGWYQGNGEIGPRALGNRSLLMDPRLPDGKKLMNLIKNRENYRPFGSSVLSELKNNYFDMSFEDKYMLFTANVTDNTLQSITHIDGTCRTQTVGEENPVFRKLLTEFYRLTGCAVLMNTSLNVAGNPIAAHIADAKRVFYETDLQYMIIGNEILTKEE